MGPRRYFSFNRLFREVLRNLKTSEQKARFAEGLASFGLDHETPQFDDDAELVRAWSVVLPDLSFGWEQRETGERGGEAAGAKRANRGTSRAKQAAAQERPTVYTPFPDGGTVTEKFRRFMNDNGLVHLVEGPRPITPEQMRWLYVHCGEGLAADLIRFCDNRGLEGKDVGHDIHETFLQMERAFQLWLKEYFPKVAEMGASLTFREYHDLRRTYGRANVLIKISQLNQKKIYRNIRAEHALNEFLKSSTSKRAGSAFWLPSYDDSPTCEQLPDFAPGFDAAFCLPITEPLKQ